MDTVISENQSAFMSRWLLSNNALIALKTYCYVSSIHDRKKGEVVVKLDMMKAYDRVEWDFLV